VSLITPEALLERLGDPRLRLADVRWWLTDPGKGRRDYAVGHLPGAVFVDADRELVAPEGPGRHPLPSPVALAASMAALGFADGQTIVAYDDAGGSIAARLWWMLDDLGHRDIHVLDGGILAWTAIGGPLTDEVPHPEPGILTLDGAWTRTIDRDGLIARLGDLTLIDARAPERYRGELEPVDPVAGHIPTARSLPLAENLTADGRFLPVASLRQRFEDLPSADVVVSCGSGINACHHALAMRVAGLPDPLLYPGSFSDWSRAGLPVATGDDPGDVPEALRPA
jgi:thiosulfate/3-mercaptopyruvate sulfurtransferase